jgi:CheY-like chemotaxis protein
MPRGGRLTIEISQTQLDADYAQMYPEVRTGRYVLISVTDTGTGMPAEVRRRAFEPFFTTKPAGVGTGLGLSMVYGFVRQSGGYVQLYSEPGQGTSLRIFLPSAGPAHERKEPSAQADSVPSPRGSETILAVEDDARVRRVAIARLRSLGYQVIEAANGAAALAILSGRPEIAMIFSDVVMPGGMSGDELAQAALAVRPDVKILLTSGYAEPAVASQGLSVGAWLKKPYTAAELARKIRSILDAPGT